MTNEEVKQIIIDRVGELAKDADCIQLASLTSIFGLITHVDNNSIEDLMKQSTSGLGLLSGLMLGAMSGNNFSKTESDGGE